ncbi:39K/pp31 [Malacosoma neustria nucleopolyhedrovirus]|uniref:39K/pp31 n=1 Tax=Malacosoma neustria nuclear polyhedrosis virus TaxID=38012 RepID=UPI000E358D74|nr:39K/pp31 [Malacosoma neustria nucleopolyhedrovirus]AUF81552.1 39K/pp31 [Malacosoma neustria nucleopolyhedrovirus]
MAVSTNELLNMCENSEYNKTNIESVKQIIAFCEKKKINFIVNVTALCGDKKKKKTSSKNKYILFNSWFNKNKKDCKVNGYKIWNYMKSLDSAKPFTNLFDFIESLNKSVQPVAIDRKNKNNEENETTTTKITQTLHEAQDQRNRLTEEFYKVLTETLNDGVSPTHSLIYEQKLNGSYKSSLTRLTPSVVHHAIDVFKHILVQIEDPSAAVSSSVACVAKHELNSIEASNGGTVVVKPVQRKRKRSHPQQNNNNSTSKRKAKQQRKQSESVVSAPARPQPLSRSSSSDSFSQYSMINDHQDNSRMSE